MAGLQITITDAGRAAVPNGPNTGTSAVTISHIGVSAVHTAGSLKGLTALPGEVKRVSTFGGDIVADDVIHITINDETTDVYSVRAFGLYLSTGVLFAVFSSPDVVVEKSAGAMVLLSADITFKTMDTAVIQFGGTGFINPPATTERLGVVELATWEETAAGNRSDVVVTPFGLLKTLQSWATNFAAAVHRHAMTAIDGLPEALASKSAVGHKHDASDTNSGIFDVARIPTLAMEKVNGLVTALANKAALSHGHVLADVDGLVQALAGKAAAAHTHVIAEVMGLTEALAGKAAAAHTHLIAEVMGLTEALAGKAAAAHTHAMADIAGLISALGGKLNRTDPIATGELNLTVVGGAFRAAGDEPGTNVVALQSGTSQNPNGHLLLSGYFGQPLSSLRATFSGGIQTVYHTGNLNLAAYAPLNHQHDAADTVSGVFALGRIPALPQEKITGLANSLDQKLNRVDPVASGEFNLISGATRLRAVADGGTIYLQSGAPAAPFGGLVFSGHFGAELSSFQVSIAGGLQSIFHTGNLKAASHAEAASGVATDRFITPAALWSFARSLGKPAYAVIPGTGLMIQCGSTTGNFQEGEAHTTLPVAFGGGCIAAVAITHNAGSNLASNYFMQIVSKNLDRIVFYANRSDSSSGNISGFDWVAIGLVSGTPDAAYSGGGGGGGGGEPTFPV